MTTKRLSKVFSHFVPQKSSLSSNNANDGMKTEVANSAEPAPVPEKEAKLPTYDELPMFKNMPGCAWSLWGENDQLGTVNLLTEQVVARAAKEEIKYLLFRCSMI
jgi:hypothetical protein